MRILVEIAVCMALSLTYERFAIASHQPRPGSAADTRVSSTTLSVLTGSSYDRRQLHRSRHHLQRRATTRLLGASRVGGGLGAVMRAAGSNIRVLGPGGKAEALSPS